MVTPKIIASELFKKRSEKSKNDGILLNTADLQVIGANCLGFRPSLLVSSEGRSYLFNCNEGLQRLSYSNKIKLLNSENIFVTETDWNNVSGSFGLSLTLQDIGCTSFTLRGADGVEGFFEATKSFMTFTTGIKTNAVSHSNFEDAGLRVESIEIAPLKNNSDSLKKIKHHVKLVSYACLMPDLPGRLDALKCRELKVPIGPKLAQLKRGEDVNLPDGRIVRSSEVCGPKNQGLYFLILDCPRVEDIETFCTNSQLNCLQMLRQGKDERQIDLIVHYSPDEVIGHPTFRDWMNRFPPSCRHILMNHSSCNYLNYIESYRMLYLLRKIDPEIFPSLSMPKNVSKLVDEELSKPKAKNDIDKLQIEMQHSWKEVKFEDTGTVIEAEAFDRIKIRPSKILERMQKQFFLDGHFEIAKLDPSFNELFDKHQKLLSTMPHHQEFEPELVFLGTGSAVPSKYRNTSCILLNLTTPKEASVILDCGEDSYGQLMRYYGIDACRNVLKRLKMIYVSHHHADHHVGLLRLLRKRRELTNEPIVLLLPPGVQNLLDYHNENFEDLSGHYHIFSTKLLKASRASNIDDAQSRPKSDLIRQLGGLIEDLSVVRVDHCANSCAAVFSFNISRPGMKTFKLAYSGDARPSDDFALAGRDCDVLIHEATFDHRGQLDAVEKKHSTTDEAIEVGKKMRAKFTILTHFSQRFAKIPYFNEKFDENVGFAFDYLTLRCPTHLRRLPIMKGILKVVYDESLREIDDKYSRKELKQRIFQQHIPYNN